MLLTLNFLRFLLFKSNPDVGIKVSGIVHLFFRSTVLSPEFKLIFGRGCFKSCLPRTVGLGPVSLSVCSVCLQM